MWNKLPRITTSSWIKLKSVKDYLSWIEANTPWNSSNFSWANSYLLTSPTVEWKSLLLKDKYVVDLWYNNIFDLSWVQVVWLSWNNTNKITSKWNIL